MHLMYSPLHYLNCEASLVDSSSAVHVLFSLHRLLWLVWATTIRNLRFWPLPQLFNEANVYCAPTLKVGCLQLKWAKSNPFCFIVSRWSCVCVGRSLLLLTDAMNAGESSFDRTRHRVRSSRWYWFRRDLADHDRRTVLINVERC